MAHQQQQQLAPSVNCSLDDIDLTALKVSSYLGIGFGFRFRFGLSITNTAPRK